MVWLAVIAAIVLLADRAVWLAGRLGWLDRTRVRPERVEGGGSTFAAFGPLFDLYAPSHKYVVEEQDRQRLERDEAESGAPPLGIDLDAGTARFTVEPPPASTDQTD